MLYCKLTLNNPTPIRWPGEPPSLGWHGSRDVETLENSQVKLWGTLEVADLCDMARTTIFKWLRRDLVGATLPPRGRRQAVGFCLSEVLHIRILRQLRQVFTMRETEPINRQLKRLDKPLSNYFLVTVSRHGRVIGYSDTRELVFIGAGYDEVLLLPVAVWVRDALDLWGESPAQQRIRKHSKRIKQLMERRKTWAAF